MDAKKYTGATVINRKYGRGIITLFDKDQITVQFESTDRSFQFPKAFENGIFIRFMDESLQNEAEQLCHKLEQERQKEAEKAAKEKEKAEKVKLEEIKKNQKANSARQIPVKKTLTYGEVFRTHADAINDCFGFSYKAYQPGYKRINEKYSVWFPGIAILEKGKYRATATSEGWVNVLSDGGKKITQYNEAAEKNSSFDPDGHMYRFVFAKYEEAEYRFIGVFKLITTKENFDGKTEFVRIGTKVDLHNLEIIE